MQPGDNSLEQSSGGQDYTSGLQGGTSQFVEPPIKQRPKLLKFNKTAFFVTGGAALLIGLIIVAMLSVGGKPSKQAQANLNSTQLNSSSISLKGISPASELQVGEADHLLINGQLQVSNSVVLLPMAQPKKGTKGQLYYDANINGLYYYNGVKFENVANSDDILGLQSKLQANSTAIQQINNKDQGVLSVQGHTGDVGFTAGEGISIHDLMFTNTGVLSITGTANQVQPSAQNGNITLSLPQDIAKSSNPTFADLTVNSLQPGSGVADLVVGTTSKGLTLQGDNTLIKQTVGSNATTVAFTSPVANTTLLFPAIAAGTYTICTTSGNCAGSGGGVTTPGGTTNHLAKFTDSQMLADSLITDDGATVTANGQFRSTGGSTFQDSVNSTAAFQIQNAAGTSNLFVADTSNSSIGINTTAVSASALTVKLAGSQTSILQLQNSTGTSVFSVDTTGHTAVSPNSSTASAALNVSYTNTSVPALLVSNNGGTAIQGISNAGGKYAVYANGSSSGSGLLADSQYGLAVSASSRDSGAASFSQNPFGGDTASTAVVSITRSSGANSTFTNDLLKINDTAGIGTGTGSTVSGNLINAQRGGTSVFKVDYTGATLHQNIVDSTTAFQIQNAAGTGNLFVADTTDRKIGINAAPDSTASTGTLTLQGTNAANITELVFGASGQTNSIAEWRTFGASASNPSVQIDSGGQLKVYKGATIFPSSASTIGLQVRGTNSQTADILRVQDVTGTSNYFKVGGSGAITAQNGTDSTAAFQIQNSAGTSNLLIADTTNTRIGIGTASPTATLDVNGSLHVGSGGIVSDASISGSSSIGGATLSSNGYVMFGGSSTGSNRYVGQYMNAGANGLTVGDVVIAANTATNIATQSTVARDYRVFGVATTTVATGTQVRIAVNGVVSVGVDTSAVSIGDQLVVSSFTDASKPNGGYATVDNSATTGIVGIALTSKAGGSTGTVSVQLRPVGGQYSPRFQNTTDSTAAFQIQNAAGTSNLFVADTTNGKIGIGTAPSSSGAKLQVTESGINNFAASFSQTNSTNSQGVQIITQTTSSADSALDIKSNAGAKSLFSVRNNGQIGIGIVSPTATLDVRGNGLFETDSNTAFQIQNSAGTSNLFVADTANGRVGIGTNTPSAQLDVAGSCPSCGIVGVIRNSSSSGYTSLRLGNDQASTAGLYFYGSANAAGAPYVNSLFVFNPLAGNLLFGTNSVIQATIASNGATTFQNSADSNTAFQIQNHAGANQLVVDTTNQRIAVGPSAVPANGVLTVGTNTTVSSGGVYFGNDTNLYRNGAGRLQTDSQLAVSRFSSSVSALNIRYSGTTVDPFSISAAGVIQWGSGLATIDTSLYRSAANTLRTDSKFSVAGAAEITAGGTVNLFGTNATINFGAASDVNLYRASADNLKTDDALTVARNFTNNGVALFQPAIDSTTAFQIQNQAGTSNLFDADTTNSRIGIGTNSPQDTLHVIAAAGSSGFRVTDSGNGRGVSIGVGASQGGFINFLQNSSANSIQFNGSAVLTFETASSIRLNAALNVNQNSIQGTDNGSSAQAVVNIRGGNVANANTAGGQINLTGGTGNGSGSGGNVVLQGGTGGGTGVAGSVLLQSSGGTVGIGTSTNLVKTLNINGTIGDQAEGDIFSQYDGSSSAWYPILARYWDNNATFQSGTYLFANGTNGYIGLEKPGGSQFGLFNVNATITKLYGTDQSWNSANATLYVGKNTGTSRSINAAGSVNASGADYAEWIPWSGTQPDKGSIVSYAGSHYIVSSKDTAAFVGNDKFSDNAILVTFAGQVPVKVTGTVSTGDILIDNDDGTASAVHPSDANVGELLSKLAIAQESSSDSGVKLVRASVGTTSNSVATALQSGGSGNFANLNISGNAIIGGKLTVASLHTDDIEIAGHIITASGQPTAQTLDAAGQNAAVTIEGNDTTGTITINSGDDTISSGDLVKLMFSQPYGKAPHMVFSASNDNATDIRIYKGGMSATDGLLKTRDALKPHTTYQFDYFIAQ